MKYIIGDNSLYDNNINIVECIVRFLNNKNKIDEIILKNYYLSYMLLYCQNFLTYLHNDKLFNDIYKNKKYVNLSNYNIDIILKKIILLDKYYNIKLDKYNNYNLMMDKLRKLCINYKNDYLFDCLYRTYPLIFRDEIFNNKDILNKYRIIFSYNIKDKRRYIKDNINKFNNKFSIKYEEIEKSKTIDNIKILRIFEYINNMFYFNFKYNKKNYPDNIKNYFIIDSYYFTFNTWLYSFFKNINLLYISTNISKNNILDTYSINIEKIYNKNSKYDKYHIYKNIWLNILNSNLLKLEKELYILVIFILIYKDIYINNFKSESQMYNYILNINLDLFEYELNKYYIIYINDINKIKKYYDVNKKLLSDETLNAKTSIFYCVKNIYDKIKF